MNISFVNYDSMTPEQWIKEFEEWLDSHDYITAPPLSDETISRESLYREREDSQLVSYLVDINVLLRLVQKTDPQGWNFGPETPECAGIRARLRKDSDDD